MYIVYLKCKILTISLGLFFLFCVLFLQKAKADLTPDQTSLDADDDYSLPTVEYYLHQREGLNIDVIKLMMQYALVCPLRQSCGMELDGKFLYDGRNSTVFEACRPCSCAPQCITTENCCPGALYGYVTYDCYKLQLYPGTTTVLHYLVGTCSTRFAYNNTAIGLCDSDVRPCSAPSGLIYKNKYCAACNGEDKCDNWRLEITCPDSVSDGLSGFPSMSEISAFIEKMKCQVTYVPRNEMNAPFCPDSGHYRSTWRIGTCNRTGLWVHYDADIDWACEHFIAPYKEFRNIFCYICNPSVAKKQEIDTNNPIYNDTDQLLTDLAIACERLPLTPRLFPYKNVFCLALNKEAILRSNVRNLALHYEAQEYVDISSAASSLSLTITFNGSDAIQTYRDGDNTDHSSDSDNTNQNSVASNDTFHRFKTFVISYFIDSGFAEKNLKTPKRDTVLFERKALVEQYEAVCGMATVCDNTTLPHKQMPDAWLVYGNPVCGQCFCNSTCVEHWNCCPVDLLMYQPYKCVKKSSFFTVCKDGVCQNEPPQVESDERLLTVVDMCFGEERQTFDSRCATADNTSNILQKIPVILSSAGPAYQNIYCMICNNQLAANVTLSFRTQCRTYIEHELYPTFKGLIQGIQKECVEVSFVPYKAKPCKNNYDLKKAADEEGIHFVRSLAGFTESSSIIESLTGENSTKEVFHFCNKTGIWRENIQLTRTICESEGENILQLPEYAIRDTVYKNFACFLCNPDKEVSENETYISSCPENRNVRWPLEELCVNGSYSSRWLPYKNMYCAECNLQPWLEVMNIVTPSEPKRRPLVAVYKYLFTLSTDDFEKVSSTAIVKQKYSCPNGTYDIINNECRSYFCNAGFQLVGDSCRPEINTANSQQYGLDITLEHRPVKVKATNGTWSTHLQQLCDPVKDNITEKLDKLADYFVESAGCFASTECLDESSERRFTIDLNQNLLVSIYLSIYITYSEDLYHLQDILVKAAYSDYYITVSRADGNSSSLERVTLKSTKTENHIHSCGYSLLRFMQQDSTTNFISYVSVDKFLTCPYVKLRLEDFYMELDTNRIKVKDSDAIFEPHEYRREADIVKICADDFQRQLPTEQASLTKNGELQEELTLFTLICTALSVTCLVITFILYSLCPSLRTTPGKINMLLCFYLSCAQSLLQFGLDKTGDNAVCSVVGVGIHFFWLGSFAAMNICAFHMYRVFVTGSLSSNHSTSNTFWKYCTYILCVPLAFVSVNLTVHLVASGGVDNGYGKHLCFISSFTWSLATFIAPSCIIFMSNFVLFSIAFHKIRTAPDVQSTRDRNTLVACLKLCVLVGLTWPILIVDSTLDLAWFSFIASGLNACQGVFIFCSYVLNRRILSLVSSCVSRSNRKRAFKSNITIRSTVTDVSK